LLEEKKTSISLVISLEVPEEELIKRLILRGKESGRSDDNEEVIKKRIQEYHKKTAPVKNYYSRQGKLMEIDGTGTIEEIFQKISAIIKEKKALQT
jgi:adenylate kinase